ncbi:hypothetical protein PORY_000416 [Pneumocystis oryctolagi]|uniref:Uncharacterized protein n=1 Tax=Pneumocystis oryctolagi TaxID=42067 RepID=A0ACB7CGZ8_9ASCO|nr:hypothetical protein PORY_000416 [Pneumocystis oryctolagi]
MIDYTKVRVCFITQQKDIEVDRTPIFVPLSLTSSGLNKVVNHLLEKDDHITFAFLIDGQFLQSSIGEYLAKKNISCETILYVEYIRSTQPPTYLASYIHDDWVSCVRASDSRHILSGCYDGLSRIWNGSGIIEAQASGHRGPVKSVCWIENNLFATSSMDQTIKIWKWKLKHDLDSLVQCKCIYEMEGHSMSVESIAVDLKTNRLLSACADGNIGIWSIYSEDIMNNDKKDKQLNKKRKKSELKGEIVTKDPISIIQGHSSSSSDIIFDKKDSTVGYSLGTDHCIKTWDLTTFSNVDTRVTKNALFSICHMSTLSLLACGSSSRHILLHDPRVSSKLTTVQTLKGHTNFVVSLSSCIKNDYMLISGSYDGLVKTWDIRAPSGSLHSIKRESGKNDTKVFSVDWDNNFGIISGGEDHCLQINQINDL